LTEERKSTDSQEWTWVCVCGHGKGGVRDSHKYRRQNEVQVRRFKQNVWKKYKRKENKVTDLPRIAGQDPQPATASP